jgi:16S rRNA (cytosine1402-N4)-methyltransferase
LKNYGEERFAPQIARAIVAARQLCPIERTSQLAAIVRESLGARIRGDWQQNPATRTFQALRIQVNDELTEVSRVLPRCVARLKTGGRIAVISFHSLEDRLVKQYFAKASKPFAGDDSLRHAPLTDKQLPTPPLKLIGRAITASDDEVARNARARSAVLRVAEKNADAFFSGHGSKVMGRGSGDF